MSGSFGEERRRVNEFGSVEKSEVLSGMNDAAAVVIINRALKREKNNMVVK